MERLTNADINELTYWLSTPAPVHVAGHLAAQRYDAGSGGSYDPATDFRLEEMVQAGLSRAQTDWTRIKRVVDLVEDGPDGRLHVEILRRAFAPLPPHALPVKEFHFPEVAVVTKAAIANAKTVAKDEERHRLLEAAWTSSLRNGDSAMTVNVRVLESDRLITAAGVVVTDDMLRWTARRVLFAASTGKEKNVAFCAEVRGEMHELVATAGDAYRRARKEIGATKRAARVEARKKNEALLDEMMGKKRAKEAERFAAKLSGTLPDVPFGLCLFCGGSVTSRADGIRRVVRCQDCGEAPNPQKALGPLGGFAIADARVRRAAKRSA